MTNFTTVGVRRLEKLATHLESGKLGHKKFDFGVTNDAIEPRCGSRGCALGELPILFRRDWKWSSHGSPILRTSDGSSFWCAAKYFGFDATDANALFVPHNPLPWAAGKQLSYRATRKQVARSIRKFIAWKLKQVAA